MAKAIYPTIQDEILALKKERNAVILAHNYQIGEIQDLADFCADSLRLARYAAKTEADVIIFCGVHFMAETASILCPDKKVILPDLEAGCSLANTIKAEDVRKWKKENPGAVVVSYVNTTAEVKAESDYCCTSANAVNVIKAIPEDKTILFLPDMYLGAYAAKMTGRKILIWPGQCHVHANIHQEDIARMRAEHPHAEFLIHPECSCVSSCLYMTAEGKIDPKGMHILSTEGMIRHVKKSTSQEYVIATEVGILHRLIKDNPDKVFYPVSDKAVCEYMKLITLEKLVHSLETLEYEVKVPKDIADRARLPIERMIALG